MYKRFFDILFSVVFLILFSPLLLFIYFFVIIFLGHPALFLQERPGLNGKLFKIVKFRTMLDRFDKDGIPLEDKDRMNTFGRILRNSSLDELPELFNILKGDMSFVGPRSLLIDYLPLYNEEQARRHEVKPGLTGCAQINGRNDSSWEDRFRLDLWYVENHSFLVDLSIISKTVKKVLFQEGISAQGEATMSAFKGNNK